MSYAAMKYAALFAALTTMLATALSGQTPQALPDQKALLDQKATEELASRMVQLIESTAFAVPGLTRASEPVKQNAELTFTAMQRTPLNPALTFQFINEIKAYLALSDSIPRPYPFPPTADQQYTELREGLQRLQQHFEALLSAQNQSDRSRNADPNQTGRYASANSKLPPPGKTPRVVFTGDSITDYWRLNEYFPGQDFVNRGIAGQTSTQVLARFEQDVVALHPKAVVILAGTSDLDLGISVAQIEDNLALMGDVAKAHGIKPAFASVLPVSDYHKDTDPRNLRTTTRPAASIIAINKWLAEHCKAEGFVYLDYHSSMIDTTGMLQNDLSDDGLHPNSKGYRVMSPKLLDAVAQLTGDAPEPKKRRFAIPGIGGPAAK